MSDKNAARNVRHQLERIFRAGVEAVAPDRLAARALEGAFVGTERVPAKIAEAHAVYLLAVGKAALGMASAIARSLGPRLARAVTIVPQGTTISLGADVAPRLGLIEAAHPVPDESSVRAARAALDLAAGVGAGEMLMLAISGGSSAMLVMPGGAVTPEDKVAAASALMRAGASIRELNIVRKHLSAIKGGRLLRTINNRANVLSLIISDVPGNDLATIGSGLTAGDPSTYGDAISVLKRHPGLWGRTPESVREHLELGAAGRLDETVKPGDAALARATNLIIGDNSVAVEGAGRAAKELGYAVDYWRELRGEANDLGRAIAAHLCAIREERLCVIAGGEPVVAVSGNGRGGRAQQCALALAIELGRIASGRRIAGLFAGTDGIDGPTDAAGAFAAPDTVARAAASGISAEQALRRNDSARVFEAIGDQLVTGPTGTNVADLFVGLVNY